MLVSITHFVSKRALYVATAWMCVFLAQIAVASCTPEPVMPYSVSVSLNAAQAETRSN